MKFILSIIAVYAYFSFALLDSLKNISYNSPEPVTASVTPDVDSEIVLMAHVSTYKRVSPFTVD